MEYNDIWKVWEIREYWVNVTTWAKECQYTKKKEVREVLPSIVIVQIQYFGLKRKR